MRKKLKDIFEEIIKVYLPYIPIIICLIILICSIYHMCKIANHYDMNIYCYECHMLVNDKYCPNCGKDEYALKENDHCAECDTPEKFSNYCEKCGSKIIKSNFVKLTESGFTVKDVNNSKTASTVFLWSTFALITSVYIYYFRFL